jgi:hypothetical protein
MMVVVKLELAVTIVDVEELTHLQYLAHVLVAPQVVILDPHIASVGKTVQPMGTAAALEPIAQLHLILALQLLVGPEETFQVLHAIHHQAQAVLDPIQVVPQEQTVHTLQTIHVVESTTAQTQLAQELPLLLTPALAVTQLTEPDVEQLLYLVEPITQATPLTTVAQTAIHLTLLQAILILIAMELKLFRAAALLTP